MDKGTGRRDSHVSVAYSYGSNALVTGSFVIMSTNACRPVGARLVPYSGTRTRTYSQLIIDPLHSDYLSDVVRDRHSILFARNPALQGHKSIIDH